MMKTIRIHELAAGGDGVGRDEMGRVTFVAGGTVGDTLEIEVFEEKRSFARASIVNVIEPGPGRREANCIHARVCGGCQWLHVGYEHQVIAKEAIMRSHLRNLITDEVTIHPIIGFSEHEYQWRRRARFTWVRPNRGEAAIVGFHEGRSDRVIDIQGCVQLSPPLMAAYSAITEILAPQLTGQGTIFALAGKEGVAIGIKGPCNPALAQQLLEHDAICGVQLGKRQFGLTAVTLEGGIKVQPAEFAQSFELGNNRLRDMVGAIFDGLKDSANLRVAEFFAGAGNLSEVFAGKVKTVVAVDTVAVTSLPADNIRFIQSRAEDSARVFLRKEKPFDVVLLDPPRVGAKALMPWIKKMSPAHVIYVSCNAATLARDIQNLGDGYQLKEVYSVDMMPQTSHFEMVAYVVRKTAL